MDINKVTFIGRLTKVPEKRTVASGQAVATFTIATNYAWTDRVSKEKTERTEFHHVVAWGKLAEIAAAYLQKGARVYLEGRLQRRAWQDAQGRKREAVEIVAVEIIMLSAKRDAATPIAEILERGEQ
jgi:single-strand DNA-binding protein